MKRLFKSIVSIVALLVFSSLTTQAQSPLPHPLEKRMSEKQIQKMDRRLTQHKAIHRKFNNQKEFLRKRRRDVENQRIKSNLHRNIDARHMGKFSKFRDTYNYNSINDDYSRPIQRQRGYRHFKRGWMLAYRYDRASFYDSEGFYYGYFNRHGYYFEGIFYRYDRFYRFKDRVRGRGLFDNYYYMPSDSRRYGFCNKRNHRVPYL